MAFALTHTAEQVQFYCLDFGGGTLLDCGTFRTSVRWQIVSIRTGSGEQWRRFRR